jgi:sortase A
MKLFANFLGVVSLLALSYVVITFLGGLMYQTLEQKRFVSERDTEGRSVKVAGLSTSPETKSATYSIPGSPVALLSIPRLQLSSIVLEGTDERELKLGPGHIAGTSLPGDGGNVGVAGHRDTFFRPLRLIKEDDTIHLTTHDRAYQYRVVSTKIVEPNEVQVLQPIGQETLTLVTCYPFDFVGPAPKRFIVRADCLDCSRQKATQLGDMK